MTREIEISHKVALLATGDEICQGDIINTNSQEIALRLAREGMHVRMHVVAPDSIHEIEQAMQFLLNAHDALIITGGLGPTSDDLTRYALSQILQSPLQFHEASWQAIYERLQRFGYTIPPESNRQQALFPEGATIIPNPNGTAAGCSVTHAGKMIFMLPGPPVECLPMVDQVVLPALKNAGYQHKTLHQHWFLFGVSEGKIAEELDFIAESFDCITGYRIFYPYIEFKLNSQNAKDFHALVAQVEKAIKPYLIGDGKHTASIALQQKLLTTKTILHITDHATGGALEAAITTPSTRAYLQFAGERNQSIRIEINGLDEYWQEKHDARNTSINITLNGQKKTLEFLYRGSRSLTYAVEFICWEIYKFITDATS